MQPPAFADVKPAETQELKAAVIAAIDHEGLTGDVSGAIGGQPDDGIGDLLGLTQPPKRDFLGPALANLLLAGARGQGADFAELAQTLGGGVSGSDVIEGEPVFAELDSQALDQPDYRRTHGIGKEQVGNGLAHGRRSDGDESAPALSLHVGNDFARQGDHAQEIHVHGLAPIVGREREEILRWWPTGVGHGDIYPSEMLGGGSYEAA